jgi:imidazolonepropionase-like amidohydrolase
MGDAVELTSAASGTDSSSSDEGDILLRPQIRSRPQRGRGRGLRRSVLVAAAAGFVAVLAVLLSTSIGTSVGFSRVNESLLALTDQQGEKFADLVSALRELLASASPQTVPPPRWATEARCAELYRHRFGPLPPSEIKAQSVATVLSNKRPSTAGSSGYYLFNATLWTAVEGEAPTAVGEGEIVLVRHVISCVGRTRGACQAAGSAQGVEDIDVAGAVITPGIVDLHSHAGVFSAPTDLHGNDDGNEKTNPLTPFLRAIDALDPEDPAMGWIRRGGVTTSQILPGSANVFGGEGVAVKLRAEFATPDDLVIRDAPRVLKMACGENPKNTYGRKGQMPSTRLGWGWEVRKQFRAAAVARAEQVRWCNESSTDRDVGLFPIDLRVDALIALLDGQALLNMHCYEVHDLSTAMRIADEFSFNITVFHHALEAWRIPGVIRDRGIAVAGFADKWGYKLEAYDGSVYANAILHKNGVRVILKSDHPVTDAGRLIQEAAKAHFYGLPGADALAAVTREPARAMRIDHRTGTLQIGKDADVVVWSRNPFDLAAVARMVFVEGVLASDRRSESGLFASYAGAEAATELGEPVRAKKCSAPRVLLGSYYFEGVRVYTPAPEEGWAVVVENGTVVCIGTRTACDGFIGPATTHLATAPTFSAIPGLISADTHIAQSEISSESRTQDGTPWLTDSSLQTVSSIRAADGMHVGTRKIQAAFAGGVTSGVDGIRDTVCAAQSLQNPTR